MHLGSAYGRNLPDILHQHTWCLVGGSIAGDFRAELAAAGVFKLCNEYPELLRGLAFLGVACSVSRDRQEIEVWATEQGINLKRVIAGLKTV